MCLNPIDRYKIIVVKEFACPHCQKLVTTSIRFRAFMRLTVVGLATVAVFYSRLPLVLSIVEWVTLWFLLNFLFVWTVSVVRPRLEPFHKKEDFQSLDLGK